MRRASNAFGIHHSHMEWGGHFAHVKNDQGCDRPRDPRPSRVYHATYLKATLSPRHHVFETPIFQEALVKTSDGCSESRIRQTAIPPHISVLCELKSLKGSLVEALTKIDATRADIVKDIMAELERRAIGAGTVTHEGLHGAIKTCLKDAGVGDIVEKQPAMPAVSVDTTTDESGQQLCHCWGAKIPANTCRFWYSRLPLPSCMGTLDVWQ
ncbi:hypothetical protein JG688_00006967 [Phytophthora aleatoria]|uniref:Uncharacterized protein n=1 Tax=Phytophthora aleatoria TaxID=2496075 RepID=A0A8J5M742_9STRA|nr:hypothetical protein JG688_00006967 [Phytophthora aleatoria]